MVDWKGKQDKDMCPSLRVLRGFANEDWKTEQDLLHAGKTFSSEEQLELDGRMATLSSVSDVSCGVTVKVSRIVFLILLRILSVVTDVPKVVQVRVLS